MVGNAGSTDPMYMLLHSINDKLTVIQNDIRDLKTSKDVITNEMDGIKFEQEDIQEEIAVHRNDICECHDKMKLITNVVIQHDDKFEELRNELLHIKANLTKAEILIFGIIEKDKENCKEVVKNFFKNTMGIQTEIEVVAASRRGKASQRPMWIQLANAGVKGLIYSNVTKLKGKKNENERGYRIQDNLPETMAEPKQRQRQIVVENRKLADGQQQTMSFKKGQLYINNDVYKKKVQVPNAKSMLKMDTQELTETKDLQVTGGHTESEGGSKFVSYVCKVGNLQEVRKAYLHMRRLHSEAHHVTMAYRLTSIDKAYDEDYLDDREFNAGRKILQKLIDQKIESVAVFVIRYYGGKHIGTKRFEIHQRLVDKCLLDLQHDATYVSKLPLKQFEDKPKSRRRSKGKSRANTTMPTTPSP